MNILILYNRNESRKMTASSAQKRAAKKYRESNIDYIRAKDCLTKYIKYHTDDEYRQQLRLKYRLRYHNNKANDLN